MNQRADDDQRGQANGEQEPERIRRTPRNPKSVVPEDGNGDRYGDRADPTPFLGNDREREVVVGFGQEVVFLSALPIPEAKQAARPDAMRACLSW